MEGRKKMFFKNTGERQGKCPAVVGKACAWTTDLNTLLSVV